MTTVSKKALYNQYMKEYMKRRRNELKIQCNLLSKAERMEQLQSTAFLQRVQEYIVSDTNHDDGSDATTKKKPRTLMTLRYTHQTYQEVQQFPEMPPRMEWIYGCEYVPKQAEEDSLLFVLEMNNDTNRIEGVGYVHYLAGNVQYHKYAIHTGEATKNRFQLMCKYRKDRTKMSAIEESVMQFLDVFCFCAPNHHKTLKGMTRLTAGEEVRFDLVGFLSTMLRKRVEDFRMMRELTHEIVDDIVDDMEGL